MLAVRAGEPGVGGVELMRRCDIHDVDRRVGRQLLYIGVCMCAEVPRESFAGFGARIGARDHLNARVTKRRRRHRERAAQPGHSEPDAMRQLFHDMYMAC
jgi:hypothetical protein